MPFDPKRIDRLAAKATLLEEQVRALVSELEELAELARTEARPEPIVAHDPEPTPAPEPVAEAEPDDVPDPVLVAEAEPVSDPEPEPEPVSEPEPEPEPVSEPAPKPSVAIPEGARLVALNMALSGKPRDETARYLRENYELADPDALLDDVYAKVGS